MPQPLLEGQEQHGSGNGGPSATTIQFTLIESDKQTKTMEKKTSIP